MNDFAAMNEVYSESKHSIFFINTQIIKYFISVFTDRHPARSTVQVAGLPKVNKTDHILLFISIFSRMLKLKSKQLLS
jgi:enamine deaminase RidA (YjgF/YER057c/UK114 family)